MNRFTLPYHLVVEEGIFSHIPDVMNDVIPDIHSKKTILVTEENLKGIFENIINDITADFTNIETYLIQSATYDAAVALAKYITKNDIQIVIGCG